DTLTDNCVTVRDRDTMTQQRVPIDQVEKLIDDAVNINKLLRKL
ncbi:MAG: hypothetical protein HUJ95_01585, partial [Bacteroidales bacterium]|nr:hypothetical protein [Bacteroidales bacterium]